MFLPLKEETLDLPQHIPEKEEKETLVNNYRLFLRTESS
jgi:hypothetical protein